MELGKKISEIRKKNEMTQEMFADKYCVTQQTVSHWENGKSYPDLEMLVRISDDFDVSLDELLKGDRKMVSQLSQMIKTSRCYRRVLVITVSIITIMAVAVSVWFGTIYYNNHLYEKQFREGLATYGFEKTELGSIYDNIYEVTANGINYYVTELNLAGANSPLQGDTSKDITAVIDPDDTLLITAGSSEAVEIPYHIVLKIRDENFWIDVFEDDQDNKDMYIYEYDAKRHLAEYSGTLNKEIDSTSMSVTMAQVYEKNKGEIDEAFSKVKEMRRAIYN